MRLLLVLRVWILRATLVARSSLVLENQVFQSERRARGEDGLLLGLRATGLSERRARGEDDAEGQDH